MSDRPLTILQLTHQGGPAGSTQSIFNLSHELARRGHRLLVGCRAGVLLARLAHDAGLPVVALQFAPLRRAARSLAELVARERVDVVNSHATLDRRALTWLRWRRRLPQPFVVTRRTMPLTLPPELIAGGLTADRTIAVSTAVARALRRRQGGELTLVALTGWGQDADRRRASDAGFDHHLTKPVDPQTLNALLAGVGKGT